MRRGNDEAKRWAKKKRKHRVRGERNERRRREGVARLETIGRLQCTRRSYFSTVPNEGKDLLSCCIICFLSRVDGERSVAYWIDEICQGRA